MESSFAEKALPQKEHEHTTTRKEGVSCVVKFCLKIKGRRHKKVTSLEINHTKGILYYYSAKYVFIFPDDEAFVLGE